ncbi:MAG: FumA C-terminus/TtdB family hydratase beta subunit [Candidatus Omnitrophica bacterium]|nr:FumA C-terminus/TtdB family hydratase beta subunit [Candidatus Omnitrophota bacterium]
MKKIVSPLSQKDILALRAGDEVLLSGYIYTARDQAHKRMLENLSRGGELPFDIKNAVIYYCGPAKTPKGKAIGSCGPTTSKRMDAFTPFLLKKGLKGMIGKGNRSEDIRRLIKKYKAIYFLAPAGCGALVSRCVKKVAPVAYPDLGPEAILRLEVKNFPLIVGIDAQGKNVYRF